MRDWEEQTRASYESKGFAARSGYGRKPALLIIDFINGFTDPTTPLGGDFSREVAVTGQLLTAFRAGSLPIIYTTIEYDPDFKDAGVFIKKVPSLAILVRGSPLCRVDDRIRPLPGEYIVSKNYASSFFGTNLDTHLRVNGVDTVVMTGCTTSGCVRASAIDSLQYGYHSIVVREGVGDRAQGPHDANLFDIDAKYADVVSVGEVLDYLRALSKNAREPAASKDFRRWWAKGADPANQG